MRDGPHKAGRSPWVIDKKPTPTTVTTIYTKTPVYATWVHQMCAQRLHERKAATAAGIVWGVAAGLLWFLFLASLFYRWDSRIAGVLAIFALTVCPILLSLELKAAAEHMAVYAYLLLVITVALQLVEFWRER